MARKKPRFPDSYLELLRESDDIGHWSFITLNGCPIEFVAAMARLARLAATYEQTTRMEWTIFNKLPVDAVVQQVKSFVNEEDFVLDQNQGLKEDVDCQRNRYHCIEAWRHAILLWTCRVFTPEQDDSQLRLISHHARVILDSVRCIPRSDSIQKQLLLPVFLAGSEMGDEENRSFVRQYCKHWSIASRFYHFETSLALLEDLWREWDPSTRHVYWWGIKVGRDNWTQPDEKERQMVTELLLG